MKIISKPRQSGKSSELIKLSAETGSRIVCANHNLAKSIMLLADQLNLKIKRPISYNDNLSVLAEREILIDDYDLIITNILRSIPLHKTKAISTNSEFNQSVVQISDKLIDTGLCDFVFKYVELINLANKKDAIIIVYDYITSYIIKLISYRINADIIVADIKNLRTLYDGRNAIIENVFYYDEINKVINNCYKDKFNIIEPKKEKSLQKELNYYFKTNLYLVQLPNDSYLVTISYNSEDNTYSFVNLTTGNIGTRKYDNIEDALKDMDDRVSEGEFLSYTKIQ